MCRVLSLGLAGCTVENSPWEESCHCTSWKMENAVGWIFVSLQSLQVENPMSKAMLLVGGAFGRQLGPKGQAHVNGIRALIKEAPEGYFASFTVWGHSEKLALCNLEAAPHQNPTVLACCSQTNSLQSHEIHVSVVYNLSCYSSLKGLRKYWKGAENTCLIMYNESFLVARSGLAEKRVFSAQGSLV